MDLIHIGAEEVFFVNLCIVFLIILTITGFGYTISYKIVEIKCIHLDGGLMEQWK